MKATIVIHETCSTICSVYWNTTGRGDEGVACMYYKCVIELIVEKGATWTLRRTNWRSDYAKNGITAGDTDTALCC